MPNPIPNGFHSITPYLLVPDVAKEMEFLKKALGATERVKMPGPNGRVMHAEMQIGDSIVMMGEPQNKADLGKAMLYAYVPDVDVTYKQCLSAGGTSVREPKDQFYGDRSAGVRDPFGNDWGIATHVEDVSPDEMKKRMAQQPVNA
jgi:uncharacterized glyoxalase superfamily protein PhnB